jgi:hypothetical protein
VGITPKEKKVKKTVAVRLVFAPGVVDGRALAQNPRGVRYTTRAAHEVYEVDSAMGQRKALANVVGQLMETEKKSS